MFSQQVRAAGLSLWELGDLLGIHPHYLHPTTERLDSLPAAVLVDLARRLDMHPCDLMPELDAVLANGRRTPHQPAGGQTQRDDTRLVLTALAYAVKPLTVDDLADALDWPLPRVAAALDHATTNPEPAGPVALRRTAPNTYTITARLDRLTAAQLHRLGQAQLYRHPLTAEQAHMLLAALAFNDDPDNYVEHRRAHPDAEDGLKRAGLVHAANGPHQPRVEADVRFSLRYFNSPAD